MYIYIYIYEEREREIVYIIYIYIYIYNTRSTDKMCDPLPGAARLDASPELGGEDRAEGRLAT